MSASVEHGHFDLAIMGGGLNGLTLAREMARLGWKVALFERKEYPFHRVCGEYLSEEVRPILDHLGYDVSREAASIKRLEVSAPSGKTLRADLPLGGLGISRYRLDHQLARAAQNAGAQLFTKTKVLDLQKAQGHWQVQTNRGVFASQHLVGSFGKRSNLDRTLNRAFLRKRSAFIGVKYHLTLDYPDDLIGLHNFPGGYAGVSRVEENRYCLCYLSRRAPLQERGSFEALEREVLSQNPRIKALFENAEFLWDKPMVINEISFAAKPLAQEGMWFSGDAAGMIVPLAGNGMAMAMAGALLMAPRLNNVLRNKVTLEEAQLDYQRQWNQHFALRLRFGRQLQRFFGQPRPTEWLVRSLSALPHLMPALIKATHGKPESSQRLVKALPTP